MSKQAKIGDKVYVVLRGTHLNFPLDQSGTIVSGRVVAELSDTYGIELDTTTDKSIIIEINFIHVHEDIGKAMERLKEFLVPITREKEVING